MPTEERHQHLEDNIYNIFQPDLKPYPTGFYLHRSVLIFLAELFRLVQYLKLFELHLVLHLFALIHIIELISSCMIVCSENHILLLA